VGNMPAKFQVELRYPGGPYSIKQRELAIGESASFDLRAIRDEQRADRTGKTLPQTINGGQFHWSIVQTPGDARIVGRAEVVSSSRRVVSSYSCPVCCPENGPNAYFNPNAYQLYIDGFAVVGADGTYWDCYYNYYTGSASFISLSTLNTGVATANNGTGELYGASAGSTEVDGDYQYVYWDNDGMDCYQHYDNGSNNAPVNVHNPPHHVQVVADNTEVWCLGGATSLRRVITYQVVDQYNTPITSQVSIGERFFSLNDHTCGAGAPNPSSCHVFINGQFTDTLFAGCTPTGGTCGYDVLNQFVYCPSLAVSRPIANLNEVVHADQITVNGNSTTLQGTFIYP